MVGNLDVHMKLVYSFNMSKKKESRTIYYVNDETDTVTGPSTTVTRRVVHLFL